MTIAAKESATEALARIQSGRSENDVRAILLVSQALGISPDEVEPRVNVLTYRAWQAKGRHVRKGEHGVKLPVYKSVPKKRTGADRNEREEMVSIPWTATVFHISQTDPNE